MHRLYASLATPSDLWKKPAHFSSLTTLPPFTKLEMGFPKRFQKASATHGAPVAEEARQGPSAAALAAEQKITAMAIFLGAVASIGGFMFGYVRYDAVLCLQQCGWFSELR